MNNELRLEYLKRDYIDLHYPTPTREFMSALMLDPTTSEIVKSQILLVWNWIKSVIAYYYMVRTALVIDEVLWDNVEVDTPFGKKGIDFTILDDTDPHVELEELLLND